MQYSKNTFKTVYRTIYDKQRAVRK